MGSPEPPKRPTYRAEPPSQHGGPGPSFQSTHSHLKQGSSCSPPVPPFPLPFLACAQPLPFPSPDQFARAVMGEAAGRDLRGFGIRGVFPMLAFSRIKEFLRLIGFTLSHRRVGPSFPQQQLETALNMIN